MAVDVGKILENRKQPPFRKKNKEKNIQILRMSAFTRNIFD
jgi:hypothetical protein